MPALKNNLVLTFIISVTLSLLTLLSPSNAANLVSGKYISTSGKKIVLHLTISSPSPLNLIVQQQFSPGNQIISTSPKAKKTNTGAGRIKWLYKKTTSGSLTLSTYLKAPVKGRFSATVRYKTPSGSFATLNISP